MSIINPPDVSADKRSRFVPDCSISSCNSSKNVSEEMFSVNTLKITW